MTVRRLKPERPRIHHRRGWGRIGKSVKLWCSCGWKWSGDAPESEVEAVWAGHLCAQK